MVVKLNAEGDEAKVSLNVHDIKDINRGEDDALLMLQRIAYSHLKESLVTKKGVDRGEFRADITPDQYDATAKAWIDSDKSKEIVALVKEATRGYRDGEQQQERAEQLRSLSTLLNSVEVDLSKPKGVGNEGVSAPQPEKGQGVA